MFIPAPPPPARAEIRIESTVLRIPELPRDAAEARRTFSSQKTYITRALADIQASLQQLDPPAQGTPAPPRGFAIPEVLRPQATPLMAILKDAEFIALATAFRDRHTEVLTRLEARGVIQGTGLAPAEKTAALEARQRQDRNLMATTQLTESMNDMLNRASESAGPGGTSSVNPKAKGLQMGMMLRTLRGVAETQIFIKARNEVGPELAEAWAPLAQHLNQQAETLLQAETISDPEFIRLRDRAKTRFLERFQLVLWHSLDLWCFMASETNAIPMPQHRAQAAQPSGTPSSQEPPPTPGRG